MGPQQIRPGQRPGDGRPNRPIALQGRDTGPSMLRPLRDRDTGVHMTPFAFRLIVDHAGGQEAVATAISVDRHFV